MLSNEQRLARFEAQEQARMKRNATYSLAQRMYHIRMQQIEEEFEAMSKDEEARRVPSPGLARIPQEEAKE